MNEKDFDFDVLERNCERLLSLLKDREPQLDSWINLFDTYISRILIWAEHFEAVRDRGLDKDV